LKLKNVEPAKDNNSVKVFLDIGANEGQNITNFRKTYGNDYNIYTFEPNPECIKIIKEKYENDNKITIMEYAASHEDGVVDFYLGESTLSSSLRKDKTSYMSNKKISVKALDLSRWIRENFSLEDEIIFYLDVEGAEYNILEKLISDDMLKWFNEVYIEFHEKKLKDLDMKRHDELYNLLIDTYKDKVYMYKKYQRDLYNRIG